MAFVQITDPDKSWELLHAGLLWFRGGDEGYSPYTPALILHWENARKLWGTPSGDTIPYDKYVLIEE